MSNYIPTIGVEVHVELKTKTKIFSNSTNGYGQMANSLTNVVDLAWDDFYEAVLPIYGITAQELKRDNSDYNLYAMFLKYLKMLRRKYDDIDLKKMEDVFKNDKDKNNVKRIIRGEIKFLDEKIKILKNVIKNKKQEQNIEDL